MFAFSHTPSALFTEHLHIPLLGVMQETVVAQTNSFLSYWLAASPGGN